MELTFNCEKYFYGDLGAAFNAVLEQWGWSSYRFFIEDLGKWSVNIKDFTQQTLKDEYPKPDSNGFTETLYRWSGEQLVAELTFSEVWNFGAFPADGRYDMPEKIYYEDLVKLTLRFDDQHSLSIEVDKIRKKARLTVIAEEAADIAQLIQSELGIL